MTREDWGSGEVKRVTVFLNGDAIPTPNARGERVVDDSFLLCFNAHSKDVEVVAPDAGYAEEWTGALDSAIPTGDTDVVIKAGETFLLQGRSLLILRKTA